jgi:hypothetical protein
MDSGDSQGLQRILRQPLSKMQDVCKMVLLVTVIEILSCPRHNHHVWTGINDNYWNLMTKITEIFFKRQLHPKLCNINPHNVTHSLMS